MRGLFSSPHPLSHGRKLRVCPSILTRHWSLCRHRCLEALAASVVKVAGRDVLATWKILVSLAVAPLLFAFYAFLATLLMIRADAPMAWRIWTPLIVMITLPFLGYAALKFGEAGMDVLK